MKKKLNFIVIVIVFGFFSICSAGISIEKVLFQKAYQSSVYNDSELVDNGGTMFVYVRNTDSVARTITEFKINGTDADTLVSNETLVFWRYWPETIPAGEVAAITVKAFDTPIADNTSVTVFVKSSSNATDSMTTTLKEQKLKLGSVMASQDMQTLYLFLRNTDNAAYTVNSIYVNGNVTSQSTFVPGTATVNPDWVCPIKISFTEPLQKMEHLSISVGAEKATGGTVMIGAPLRLVRPKFEIGTWSSSLPEPSNEDHQQYVKRLHLTHETGSGNWTHIDAMYNKYNIGSFTLDTSYNSCLYNRNLDRVTAYFIDDEPDHGAEPVGPLLDENMFVWRTDPTHPTYINLCKNHRFAQYSHFTDIVGMDHYAMWAPNILGNSAGDFEEVIEYMDILKLNTEPRIMWPWPQLVADGTWSKQPPAWGINLQFWSHIMCGAKGYKWFKYGPGYESSWTSQMNEAEQVTRELNLIKGILLYGEVAGPGFATPSNSKIKSRVIVGEDAIAVIVTNYDYHKWRTWPWEKYQYDIDPVNASVNVVVPWWIPIDQIQQVTASGLSTPNYTINNAMSVTINFNINEDSLIYLIGKNDTQLPSVPQDFKAVVHSGNTAVLSWKESFDNYGINQYHLYKNGTYHAPLKEAIYTDNAVGNNALYKVVAVDAAWNTSGWSNSVLLNDTLAPTGSVVINSGDSYTTSRNVNLTLSATDNSGTVNLMRFSNDASNWTSWQSYGSSKSWTLSEGNEIKTVYVQFRDSVGNVSNYSDDIVYTKKGDFNYDLEVDIFDLEIFVTKWLSDCEQDCPADFNSDGSVNFEDFSEFAENWLFNSL